MNKINVSKAARKISRSADEFDQVTKGQCKKLTRLIQPVPVKRPIYASELEQVMKERNFTPEFIAQILEELNL